MLRQWTRRSMPWAIRLMLGTCSTIRSELALPRPPHSMPATCARAHASHRLGSAMSCDSSTSAPSGCLQSVYECHQSGCVLQPHFDIDVIARRQRHGTFQVLVVDSISNHVSFKRNVRLLDDLVHFPRVPVHVVRVQHLHSPRATGPSAQTQAHVRLRASRSSNSHPRPRLSLRLAHLDGAMRYQHSVFPLGCGKAFATLASPRATPTDPSGCAKLGSCLGSCSSGLAASGSRREADVHTTSVRGLQDADDWLNQRKCRGTYKDSTAVGENRQTREIRVTLAQAHLVLAIQRERPDLHLQRCGAFLSLALSRHRIASTQDHQLTAAAAVIHRAVVRQSGCSVNVKGVRDTDSDQHGRNRHLQHQQRGIPATRFGCLVTDFLVLKFGLGPTRHPKKSPSVSLSVRVERGHEARVRLACDEVRQRQNVR
eukprot:1397666-Rhodomonas_salina.2